MKTCEACGQYSCHHDQRSDAEIELEEYKDKFFALQQERDRFKLSVEAMEKECSKWISQSENQSDFTKGATCAAIEIAYAKMNLQKNILIGVAGEDIKLGQAVVFGKNGKIEVAK